MRNSSNSTAIGAGTANQFRLAIPRVSNALFAAFLAVFVLFTIILPAQCRAQSRAELAAKIRDSKRIVLATFHISKVKDKATAKQNILDTAAGKKAQRSAYENAPGGAIYLDLRLLKGMLELSKHFKYRVSEIAGGSHSKTSRHYAGIAVDINMINGRRVNIVHPDFRRLMKMARELGAMEVLGPGDAGHSGHIHAAWPRRREKEKSRRKQL